MKRMGKNNWKPGPGANKNSKEWFHKEDRYSFVRVWKPAFPHEENKRKKLIWNMSARKGLNGRLVKRNFRNKSMALKSAKAFMRRN